MGHFRRIVLQLAEDFGLRSASDVPPEYLTQKDAAKFCCLSLRQFRKVAPSVGLFPISFGGRLLYKKDDCIAAIESERWRASS